MHARLLPPPSRRSSTPTHPRCRPWARSRRMPPGPLSCVRHSTLPAAPPSSPVQRWRRLEAPPMRDAPWRDGSRTHALHRGTACRVKASLPPATPVAPELTYPLPCLRNADDLHAAIRRPTLCPRHPPPLATKAPVESPSLSAAAVAASGGVGAAVPPEPPPWLLHLTRSRSSRRRLLPASCGRGCVADTDGDGEAAAMVPPAEEAGAGAAVMTFPTANSALAVFVSP